MQNANIIRTGRHCVYSLHAHLVFVTKYRRTVFTRAILDAMRLIFTDICKSFEATLIEFEGERDHVHLLVHYPPKVSLSRLVNSLKGVSSLSYEKNLRPFTATIGEGFYGHPVISLVPAAALHCPY